MLCEKIVLKIWKGIQNLHTVAITGYYKDKLQFQRFCMYSILLYDLFRIRRDKRFFVSSYVATLCWTVWRLLLAAVRLADAAWTLRYISIGPLQAASRDFCSILFCWTYLCFLFDHSKNTFWCKDTTFVNITIFFFKWLDSLLWFLRVLPQVLASKLFVAIGMNSSMKCWERIWLHSSLFFSGRMTSSNFPLTRLNRGIQYQFQIPQCYRSSKDFWRSCSKVPTIEVWRFVENKIQQ